MAWLPQQNNFGDICESLQMQIHTWKYLEICEHTWVFIVFHLYIVLCAFEYVFVNVFLLNIQYIYTNNNIMTPYV